MSLHLEFKKDTGISLYDPCCTNPELAKGVAYYKQDMEAYVKWLEEKIEYLRFQNIELKSEIIVNNSLKK